MNAKDDIKISAKKAQRNAVLIAGFTAFVLAIAKFIVGIFSGSVAVLSSAIDSMLDLLVSVLNFFAIRKSQALPNAKFNFGYTKVEALAALFEGILIIGIALFILYESIMKIRSDEVSINVDISILVMCFSLVVTGILVTFLNKVAKRTNNLIIKADALHYKSDLVTNLAVVVALLIIKFSGFTMIDAIFGIVISGYIAVSAVNLMKESVGVLLDKALDESVTDTIKEIILSKPQVAGFHGLTSRQSANTCYFGVHLVFNREILLFDAHEISNEIEREIALKFSEFEWNFTTHLDPYDD